MTDTPVMVITGTRKGLGAALARHYTALGYVVVGCSRTVNDDAGFDQIAADVTSEGDVRRLFGLYGRNMAGSTCW